MEKPKILVVDDESIIVLDLTRRLERLGYTAVGEASSGEGSVAQATEIRLKLVLMDTCVPGSIDSIEAAAQIQERPDIRRVFVTASGDEATVERAKVTAPFVYILKPFDDRDLRVSIEVGLYKHKLEQELEQKTRELAALNNLFVRHLNEQYETEETYGRLAEGFMKLADEMQALAKESTAQGERMQIPPIERELAYSKK